MSTDWPDLWMSTDWPAKSVKYSIADVPADFIVIGLHMLKASQLQHCGVFIVCIITCKLMSCLSRWQLSRSNAVQALLTGQNQEQHSRVWRERDDTAMSVCASYLQVALSIFLLLFSCLFVVVCWLTCCCCLLALVALCVYFFALWSIWFFLFKTSEEFVIASFRRADQHLFQTLASSVHC